MKNFKYSSVLLIALLAFSACATKPATDKWESSNTAQANSNTSEAQSVDSASKSNTADNNIYAAPIKPAVIYDAKAQTSDEDYQLSTTKAAPVVSIIDIGDRVYFATDSFSLSEEARQILARQANYLVSNPEKSVLIAGNCDERGTREYNLALGARRANSVKDFLVSLGVDEGRISTVSYGKERPIDERSNPDGWAVNRNAQTKTQK